MSAEPERFATHEELHALFDTTRNWLVDHGNATAARGMVGSAPDGYPIVTDPAMFSARLPVTKLREVVPDHLRTLGVARRIHAAAMLPFYFDEDPEDLQTELVMLTMEHSRRSAFRATTYILDPTLDEGGSLDHELNPTEPSPHDDLSTYLGRLVGAVNAPMFEKLEGTDRITFSQYTALNGIMSLWTTRFLDLSPGRPRRYKWK